MSATGWQSLTVRGAMAGALKKKLGLTVTSEKIEGADGLTESLTEFASAQLRRPEAPWQALS